MVAITEETTKQDTKGEWVTYNEDEWVTDDTEDDEEASPDTVNSRGEWQPEDA